MIEDKELGLKVAESPEEAMITQAIENSEKRLRELKLSMELDEVVLEYLKSKVKK